MVALLLIGGFMLLEGVLVLVGVLINDDLLPGLDESFRKFAYQAFIYTSYPQN